MENELNEALVKETAKPENEKPGFSLPKRLTVLSGILAFFPTIYYASVMVSSITPIAKVWAAIFLFLYLFGIIQIIHIAFCALNLGFDIFYIFKSRKFSKISATLWTLSLAALNVISVIVLIDAKEIGNIVDGSDGLHKFLSIFLIINMIITPYFWYNHVRAPKHVKNVSKKKSETAEMPKTEGFFISKALKICLGITAFMPIILLVIHIFMGRLAEAPASPSNGIFAVTVHVAFFILYALNLVFDIIYIIKSRKFDNEENDTFWVTLLAIFFNLIAAPILWCNYIRKAPAKAPASTNA